MAVRDTCIEEMNGNNSEDNDHTEQPQLRQPVKITPSHGGETRKRKRNPESWKQNIRKKKRQSGESYENVKGNNVAAKSVKTVKDCTLSCKFKCSQSISEIERKNIFTQFWTMNQQEQKHFFNTTTERKTKDRCRTKKGKESRKNFSYFYHFAIDETRYRVCKEFYLSTLDVSSRRISYFHETKDEETSKPSASKWGKHPKKKLTDECKKPVYDLINSIPRIESHYCRSVTKKEYFEASLNLQKLYVLYITDCETKNIQPAKIHMYRDIFNHNFNIEFQKPKKDLCDVCYQYDHTQNPTEEQTTRYNNHVESKTETRAERNHDREMKSGEVAVVCIDLENVISLPKSNVGNFFYKRKLSQYNLTGHCSLNKKGYCILWHEGMAGRGGNDITSAVTCMLEKIIEDKPTVKKFILWFDSCVPQNRNSYMSAAMREFILKHPQIKIIEQKFCEPGHSCIQEVDNIHSQIDRALSSAEIFSPLSVLRTLPNVNRRNRFTGADLE